MGSFAGQLKHIDSISLSLIHSVFPFSIFIKWNEIAFCFIWIGCVCVCVCAGECFVVIGLDGCWLHEVAQTQWIHNFYQFVFVVFSSLFIAGDRERGGEGQMSRNLFVMNSAKSCMELCMYGIFAAASKWKRIKQ